MGAAEFLMLQSVIRSRGPMPPGPPGGDLFLKIMIGACFGISVAAAIIVITLAAGSVQ